MKKAVKIICIVLAVTVIVCFSGMELYYYIATPRDVKAIADSGIEGYENIKLTAHRGFCSVAPENSIPSFEKAAEYGFYAAECDIHLTSDGVWVVSHDDNLFLMTNAGIKKIAEMTYEQTQKYTINRGANADDYEELKIPTLAEYLKICAEGNIRPQIEIKNGSPDKLKEITDLLEEYGLKDKAMIISFYEDLLIEIKKIDETVDCWYLTHEITDEDLKICTENGFALGFEASKNENDVIKNAGAKGIQLSAWTVDSFEELQRMHECGVEYITTNTIHP